MYKGNSRVYMGLQGYKGITNMGVQKYTRDYRGI